MIEYTTKATPDRRVTLKEFADSVGCHMTTASRLRRGDRMPGRELFLRIVNVYGLDPREALLKFTGPREEFGLYLRENVFKVTEDDVERDRQLSTIRHN